MEKGEDGKGAENDENDADCESDNVNVEDNEGNKNDKHERNDENDERDKDDVIAKTDSQGDAAAWSEYGAPHDIKSGGMDTARAVGGDADHDRGVEDFEGFDLQAIWRTILFRTGQRSSAIRGQSTAELAKVYARIQPQLL